MEIIRQKNVATYITFPLVDADGDPVTSAGSLDSQIDQWADGSAPTGFGACSNEATEIGSTGVYYLSLTQTEMNQDYIYISIASTGAKTQHILIRTMVGDPLLIATTALGALVWSVTARTITGGTITTVSDKTGYSISGTITTLDALNTDLDSSHGAGSWLTATGFSVPNEYDTVIAALQTDLDNPNQYKATGFSTHNAADVWTTGSRELSTPANYMADVATALTDIDLDHLIQVTAGAEEPTIGSYLDQIMHKDGSQTFSQANDSLEAIRDQGDSAWITAVGFSNHSAADVWAVGTRDITGGTIDTVGDKTGYSITGTITTFDALDTALDSAHGAGSWLTGGGGSGIMIQTIPSIPKNIDLSDTKTVRIALYVLDISDDLPTVGELTAGTIKIERSADGGTSWSTIRSDVACSKHAGGIYYDEVFSSGNGYASADMIKITFKSQKATISANDFEIADATDGVVFITRMDSGLSGGGPSAGDIADAVWEEAIVDHSTSSTFGGKNQLVVPSETLADYKATGFSTHAAADIWSVGTREITGGTISTVSDKTGYSISGTKNILDDLNDITAAAVWSETGRELSTPNNYKADVNGLATATNLQTVDDNIDILISDVDRLRYRGSVWIDDTAANTNTVLGTDGVPENPVSTLAAALTIAIALNVKSLTLMNDTSITLSQSFDNWCIKGVGGNNTISLNNQSIDFAEIIHCVVTGTQGGSGSVDLHGCYIDSVLGLSCDAIDSMLAGDFTIKNSNDVLFINCASAVAGNATPIMTFTAGATDVSFRHYSGGIEVKSMTSDHTMSLESDGQLIINADCTGGAISRRGNQSKTDNSGNVTVTEIAALDRDVIADAILDELIADHISTGSLGEEIRRLRGLNGEYLVAEYTFVSEDNTVIEFWQYDTEANFNTHNKSTGLIGSWIINTTYTLGKPDMAKSKKLT